MVSLFGTKFEDGKLCEQAEQALAADPIVNSSGLEVTSANGVVTVMGRVASELEKRRAVEAIEGALRHAGLRYERMEDQIRIT